MREYGIINPSDQTHGYAQEVVCNAKKIARQYDISFKDALTAYEIAAKTQLNDGMWSRLYVIAEAIEQLAEAVQGLQDD